MKAMTSDKNQTNGGNAKKDQELSDAQQTISAANQFVTQY
jgi:hypothetical protein